MEGRKTKNKSKYILFQTSQYHILKDENITCITYNSFSAAKLVECLPRKYEAA